MKRKSLTRKLPAMLLAFVMCLTLLPGMARAADANSVKFAVMSTSDVHGKVWEQNILNDTAVTQNLLRVSTAVTQARETYGAENVLVVDNGDLYQGTPISSYNINLYTQGLTEDMNPMAVALAHIGYDAAILGNHEFNYPWSAMSDIYAYLKDQGVETVCCNLYYEKDDEAGHKAGERVFPAYLIKEIDVGGQTFRIGVVGVENTDCPRWDVSDNFPNMLFAAPDNKTLDLAVEVNAAIADMKADLAKEDKSCDFIIVSYHGALNNDTSDLVVYQNTENQVSRIIAGTTDVDMIISGHDHSTAYTNTTYPNKDGSKDVLVVNAGGTELTNAVFEVTYDASASKFSVAVETSENLKLSDYEYDKALYEKIQPYVDVAVEYVNTGVGTLADGWDKDFEYSNNNCYLQQTDTIDLINRTQIAMGTVYLNQKYASVDELNAKLREIYGEDTAKQYHGKELEVDMSSTSIVTTSVPSGGELSMKDIYGFYRYDNALYLITMTGQEIFDLLEYNAATRLQAKVSHGSVTFSNKGDYNDAFTNPVFYGLNFTYDLAQPENSRVQIEGFANGKEFKLDETYIFAINNYHLGNAANAELAKYTTADAIWSQTDDLGGGYVQDLMAEYVTAKTEADGMVYTTAEAAKNGETPSHWKLAYTGDLTGVSVSDDTAYTGAAVTELYDGDKIFIYNESVQGALGLDASGSSLAAAAGEIVDGAAYLTDGAAVLTVGVSDRGITFRAESGYLAADTANALAFSETLTDACYWTVAESGEAPGKFLISSKSGELALEGWSGAFTTYTLRDQDVHWMELYRVADTAVKTSADGIADGDSIVFYYDPNNLAISATASGSKLSDVEAKPVDTKSGGSILTVPTGAGVFTVERTADGQFRFKTKDGYLTSGATGGSLTVEAQNGDLSLWDLEETENGYLIHSVGANYNETYNQYLEYYSGFTMYGLNDGSDQTAYTFQLYKISAAPAASVPGDDAAGTEDTDTPDANVPDEETPDVETPDAETPDTDTPDTDTPDVETPDADTPDTDTPDDNTPDGESDVSAKVEELFSSIHADDSGGAMMRGMLAALLYNLEGSPEQTVANKFADVADSAWYAAAVNWAAEKGIVVGYGDGTFGAEDPITWEQLAVMLWRYEGQPSASASDYAGSVSEYAVAAINWAAETGILDGVDSVLAEVTCGQAKQMIVNYLLGK